MKPERKLNNSYLIVPVIVAVIVTLSLGVLLFWNLAGSFFQPSIK